MDGRAASNGKKKKTFPPGGGGGWPTLMYPGRLRARPAPGPRPGGVASRAPFAICVHMPLRSNWRSWLAHLPGPPLVTVGGRVGGWPPQLDRSADRGRLTLRPP